MREENPCPRCGKRNVDPVENNTNTKIS